MVQRILALSSLRGSGIYGFGFEELRLVACQRSGFGVSGGSRVTEFREGVRLRGLGGLGTGRFTSQGFL